MKKFWSRQDEDYTEFVMDVINAAINAVQTCDDDQREITNREIFA